MHSLELARQHASIRSLIRRAGHETSTRDLEMLAHWGRYLCVLTSGFIENTVRTVYGGYLAKGPNTPQTIRFARRQIESVQNPKAGRLVEIAGSFDSLWGNDLKEFLEENFRGDGIDTIMRNRHLIAHGRNSDISIARVDQYLIRAAEVATFMETQCGM